MPDDKTYSVKEAAAILGLAEFTVRKKFREGTIKATKKSAREGFKVSHTDLMAYKESMKTPKQHSPLMMKRVGSKATSGIRQALEAIKNGEILPNGEEVLTLIREYFQNEISFIKSQNEDLTPDDKALLSDNKLKILSLQRELKDIELKYLLNQGKSSPPKNA